MRDHVVRPNFFLVSIQLASLFSGARLGHHGDHPLTEGMSGRGLTTTHADRRYLKEGLLQGRPEPRAKVTKSTKGGFLKLAGVGDQWCDVILGCLNLTDDWYSSAPYGGNFKIAFRALNFLPETRKKINTRFHLHTREAKLIQEIQLYNSLSLLNSTFNCTRPTKIIIHGHLDHGRKKWVEAMANSLLSYGDYNIFRLDWGGGSQTIYSQALANTRVVGLEVARLVQWLSEKYQVDTRKVHIIGHSLGAHIAGYAGEKIIDLGRISGLDPAGTGFNTMPDIVHLDPNDAIFVDVIHSNAGAFALGTREPMGHLDFYPNGGGHQPSCNFMTKIYELLLRSFRGDVLHGLRYFFACSHDQSIDFFMDSLDKPSAYMGHECKDYSEYLEGGCGSCGEFNEKCAPMGIAADNYVQHRRRYRKYVKMFLTTGK